MDRIAICVDRIIICVDRIAGSDVVPMHACVIGRHFCRVLIAACWANPTPEQRFQADRSALSTAMQQVRTADVDAVAAANREWWRQWWAGGATIELGPRRQTLESFWYGQQYMLGSMSRPCVSRH